MNEYDRAVKNIRNDRRARIDAAAIAWDNAVASNDELYSCFVAYTNEAIKAAKHLPNELSKAKAALDKLTAKLAVPPYGFEPPYSCSMCKDTGLVNGKYCSCVVKRVINADGRNFCLPHVDFDAARASSPASIKIAYAAAADYISSFPRGDRPFFTVVGAPGTGKTYLAAAIATELMSRGASAVAITAFELVRRALDFHKQFTVDDYVDTFTPALDCDVLVIDDLGRENILKNVTQEYLYTVINERWLNKKYTVITSNLSPADISSRYGGAITTRMFDKARSVNFAVTGKNERVSK